MATTVQTIIIDSAVNVGASVIANGISGGGTITVYTVPAGKTFWGTLSIDVSASTSGGGTTASASASIGGVTVASASSAGGSGNQSQSKEYQIIGPGSAIVISSSAVKGGFGTGANGTVSAALIGTLISNS